MSKVTDELHRDLLSAAAILSVIGSGTKTMNPEYAGHLSGLFDRVRAALEAASSTPDGDAVGDEEDRLQEIAEGAWGDNPMVRGKARDMLAARHSIQPVQERELSETMRAEVIYEGEDNSWLFKLTEIGNRDGAHYERSIELSADTFPEGTVISIREPVTLSCLSHNAGEIEAGGEVERLTKERDQAQISAAMRLKCWEEACKMADVARGELYATVRKFNCDNAEQFWENIGILRARAEASDKRIAELEAALGALDGACDALAASRGQTTYLSMIDNDLAAPLLLELDAARSAGRLALSSNTRSGE